MTSPRISQESVALALSYYETMREGEMNNHQRVIRAALQDYLALRSLLPFITEEVAEALDAGMAALEDERAANRELASKCRVESDTFRKHDAQARQAAKWHDDLAKLAAAIREGEGK